MTSSFSTLSLDDFQFDTLDVAEDITRYVQGGYHPIIIGDILGEPAHRQYRIMHKLGWGSYATVWFAQTMDGTGDFVSLKITTSEEAQTREAEMLQRAGRVQSGDQSQSHVVKLLDHFMLHGPNGTHTVIVTEVVAPILSLLASKRSPSWRKAAAYGLAQAMAQIHANGIVHGDWYLGNIGIAIPQLAQEDPEEVLVFMSPPELTPILTFDPAKQTASLPRYLIRTSDMGDYYCRVPASALPQVKVFDFGNAHETGTLPRVYQCATIACAPETVFAYLFEKIDIPPLEPPADVWALGATIYEIITGSVLFEGAGMIGLPSRMSELTGRIPPHWEKWFASLSSENISQAASEKWWASHWKYLRWGCENDADTNALIRLLKRILVLDPAERPTAAEVVNDPWFQDVSLANGSVEPAGRY